MKHRILISFVFLLIIFFGWFLFVIHKQPPKVSNNFNQNEKRVQINEHTFSFQDSRIHKNKYGLWEMYVTGSGFELGYKSGMIADSLVCIQEDIFIQSIKKMIPSETYLNFLKYFVAFFNRNMDAYIPIELLEEIYGVSLFASDKYNYIGNPYQRLLNYHGAHDIGHALQNMNLVACTAFEVDKNSSKDSCIIIGRNMDFSSGDDFAINKIISFYKPDKGNNFCFITWGGMIGAISGMNDKGLVVTLNAANSAIPTGGKMPVSLLARHVLQHASTIEEAFLLIKNAEVFVSESFLVSSATESKTVVIEKSIKKTDIYENANEPIILTNHFQGDVHKSTPLNIDAINDETSAYRWYRVKELLTSDSIHDEFSVASILRDKNGLKNRNIGLGNEKSINQLIAHHSVIFKPEKLQIWVSTNPYQLGRYLCYNLSDIFNEHSISHFPLFDTINTINEDPFLYSKEYAKFQKYKETTTLLKQIITINHSPSLPERYIQAYISLNPNFYYPYFLTGEYFYKRKDINLAKKYYLMALTKEVPRLSERKRIEDKIKSIEVNYN